MQISTFEDLVRAAREHPQPQRLLFVCMGAELPPEATPEQRAAVAAGQGGVLVPLLCVDKAPDELTTMAALVEESQAAGPPWTLLFAAALAGAEGKPPTPAQVERALNQMLERIKSGHHENFIPFNREGQAVRLR